MLVDEDQRLVNEQGFLKNEKCEIVDSTGRVMFDKCQLRNGNIPMLYTYEGNPFSIFDVMGCLLIDKKRGVVFNRQ